MFDIPFDVKEMEASNLLITATNRMGKSRLACGIAHNLKNWNWVIHAFDPCGNYKEISDIEHRIKIYPEQDIPILPIDESVVIDLSLLRPSQQQDLVNFYLEGLWNFKVIHKTNLWHLILLEEMHNYARNTRGLIQQNLLRTMTQGRNQKIRVLGISVDLALIDPCFIRLCQQRYHGRLGIEENSKRKFRSYYGKDYMRIATEGLDVGDFLYINGSKIQIIHAPLFTPQQTPQILTIPKTSMKQRILNALS